MGTDLAATDKGPIQLLLDLEAAGALDEVSLVITSPIEYERWESLGTFLGSLDRRTRWYLGDWLIYGEAEYGEEAAQAVDDPKTRYDVARRVTGLDSGTLQNIRSICEKVPRERRRAELGFWIHAEVAPLEPQEQIDWLQKAIDEGWGRTELRAAIKAEKNPPADEPPDGGGDGSGEHLTIAERIEQAARLVYHQGQRTDDGSAIVPAEPWAQLTAALGEE